MDEELIADFIFVALAIIVVIVLAGALLLGINCGLGDPAGILE